MERTAQGSDLRRSDSIVFRPNAVFQAERQSSCVVIHVDDLAVVGSPSFVDQTIDKMGKKFTIGANEELHHFLYLKISCDPSKNVLYLSQSHYIDELKSRFLNNTHVNVATPTDSNFRLLVPHLPNKKPSSGPYNQLIGSLLWAAQCTRPDIAFAVNRLSQFLRDPSDLQWLAGLRILHYLCSTKHLCLRLGGSMTCSGFSDLDWAEDRSDCRLTSAYTFRVGDGAISWKSRKQATTSLSSTEAEYKAMSDS